MTEKQSWQMPQPLNQAAYDRAWNAINFLLGPARDALAVDELRFVHSCKALLNLHGLAAPLRPRTTIALSNLVNKYER